LAAQIKVGIITYHFSNNYGALMQAYGLRQWFINQKINAEFLPYHPSYVEEGGAFDRPWKLSLWRKNATILYMKLAHWWGRVFSNKAQRSSFEKFRYDYLGLTGLRLKTACELTKALDGFSLLVCGSDQIWNPSIQRGLDPVYFLEIPGAENMRKVAYAPSFGRAKIESNYFPELLRLSNSLDSISVRESSGVDILKCCGVSVEKISVMPDPTILLGDFSSLLDSSTELNNGVFCYALRTDEVIRDVAKIASVHLGCTLHAPRNSRQRWRDIGIGVSPGPLEWLRMLASSKIVVSNSFHGIALAIVLNRPFVAVALPGKRAHMNERVMNLLELTGLSHRLISEAHADKIRNLADSPIDWVSINAKLASLRSDAENYLKMQIDAVSRGNA